MAKKEDNKQGGFENKELQDLSKAFERSTSMPTVPTPEPQKGQTTFAKEDPQYNQNK